jgi:hypothetical protein
MNEETWILADEKARRSAAKFARPGTAKFDALYDAGRDAAIACAPRAMKQADHYLSRAIARAVRAANQQYIDPVDVIDVDPVDPRTVGPRTIDAVIVEDVCRCADERGAEIVRSIANGEAVAEIASRLGVSPSTVSRTKTAALEKYTTSRKPIRRTAMTTPYNPFGTLSPKRKPDVQLEYGPVKIVRLARFLWTVSELRQWCLDTFGHAPRHILPNVWVIDGRLETQCARDRAENVRRGGRDNNVRLLLTVGAERGLVPHGLHGITSCPVPDSLRARHAHLEALRELSP